MKKLSWFLVMALFAFSCQLQNEEVSVSGNASGATPGAYVINSSSNDGYTFTIIVDQSEAQAISHMMFKFASCEGEELTINNIISFTANGEDMMDKLGTSTGNGDVCFGVFSDPFIKLDQGFEDDVVEVVITLDTKSSGGSFLIKSAQNCFGLGDEDYAFSYNCDTEKCYEYQGETAWANGPRYISRGNWATYTPYEEGTVNVYAGQHMLAGTASMSGVVDGMVTITIVLGSDWSLQGSNSVKIQGYDVAPSGNPSPGRFAHKGDSLEVSIPAANYYGIHLDVQTQVEVPCE